MSGTACNLLSAKLRVVIWATAARSSGTLEATESWSPSSFSHARSAPAKKKKKKKKIVRKNITRSEDRVAHLRV